MPIVPDDIKFFLSGGVSNSNPNASLGGSISNTQIVNDALHNLFDRVSANESKTGDTEYRAFYVKNDHGSLTWRDVVVWIKTNTPAGDAVQIGKEPSGGSGKQTIASEKTAPGSPVIAFVDAPTRGAGLTLGDIGPGAVYMIWVKRIVPAGTQVFDNNYFEIQVSGETEA